MTTMAERPPAALRRGLLLRALAACLFAALHAPAARAQTHAPSEEVIETVRTPAGELSLLRRREQDEGVTIVLKLGGKVLAEKDEGYRDAYVYGAYPSQSPRYVLVSMSAGGLVCGAKFTVIDLSSEGAAKASRDFGNCSDAPRVAYRRGTLTITFPAGPRKRDPGTHYVGPGQVWTYSGRRLRRAGGRR